MGRYPPTAGLRELMERLWVERHLLELLEFKLAAVKLFLTADVRRFISPALGEVEHAIEQVRTAEIRRTLAVAKVAEGWQVPAERVTLGYLVDHAPEPAAEILEEHGEALHALTTQIEDLAAESRLLAQGALDHTRKTIDLLVGAEFGRACGTTGARADVPARPNRLRGVV